MKEIGNTRNKENVMLVVYEGMKCYLTKNKDNHYVQIAEPKDKDKAYKNGFECMGYPSEIAKKITQNEYNTLKNNE